MINFLRENSYTIIKMFVNQIGMTVFGLMLAMATSKTDILLTITSIFAVLFYMFLLYSMSWDCGAKDKIRVDGGRAKYTPMKGIYMSLCANSVNIILAVCIIIGFFSASWSTTPDPGTGLPLMLGTPEWAANLYGIANLISGFLNAMYLGLIKLYLPNIPFAYLIAVIPAIAASGFGYFMGVKNLRFIRLPQNSAERDLHK